MANLQVKIDDQLNADAKAVAASLGMDVNTAVRIFLTQMVRDKALPFRPVADPFYSLKNQAVLKESIEQGKRGEFIIKTMEELENMEK
ncbi:type II toxin-antitoxin system RelB/DinJ family antitoxin [Desulfosarcina sp. OttesenSCG-928-G17]|nr:type II toxin-antitoxin system RelB/DinJ family antitoxin [Desulfosarcina sp. OttesenSCG-928-G17]